MAENVIIDKNTFNDATRLGFYVKSILRLACNMVTEAPQDLDESYDIQAMVLIEVIKAG